MTSAHAGGPSRFYREGEPIRGMLIGDTPRPPPHGLFRRSAVLPSWEPAELRRPLAGAAPGWPPALGLATLVPRW